MIFLYKLKEQDKVEDFDLQKVLDLIANDEMYAFESRNAKSVYEMDILDFKEKQEGNFIIFNSESGLIRRERWGFAIEIIDEELLYIIKTETPCGDSSD